MPLGRAFETASVSLLLNKLATQDVIDFLLKWKIDDALLKKLKMTLLQISTVLNHAEEKQVNDQCVKDWLHEVRDAAYDAEDIMDEIATDALGSHNSTNKVLNFAYDSLNISESVKEGIDFKVKDVAAAINPFKERIEPKMRTIVARLEDIAKQKDVLSLREDAGGMSSEIINRLPTTPSANESQIYGREFDKQEIIKLLMLGGENDGEVSVVPIAGMGGIGKTTLAQIVYNDEKMEDQFDLKGWACVSDVFDVMRITKTVLESMTQKPWSTNNLELLQNNLKNLLNNKKFLLVLDDVWNENYGNWDKLRIPFTVGAPGSKIIVTTRSEVAASIMGTFPTYHLKELSKDDCWSLLEKIACPSRNSNAYPKLKEIGEKIAMKCKGLPLAAKVLGGLLRSNTDEKHWRKILDSSIWDLQNSDILPALRLSYHHLPANLKRCFAYCSLFPKDFEFETESLILFWMAEGFVEQPEGYQRMEEVGREYFADLLSRSFFQQLSNDKSLFVMHDLIHDLAQVVSGKTCLQLEDQIKLAKHNNVSHKTRHFSYIRGVNDVYQKFEPFSQVKCLRTFLPLNPLRGYYVSYLTNKLSHDILPKLRFLRLLSLSGYLITTIPDSIGNLKHLRYLDFSRSLIKNLPESISSLYNLQALILIHCRSLTMLPSDIGSLINLRHLNTTDTWLEEMPQRMGKLTSLQMLSNFVVGKGSGSGIGELQDLSDLHGKLSISGLHNVVSVKDAIEAKLALKQHLDELVFEWSSSDHGSRNERIDEDVLDALQPHEGLKKLTINYYGGTEFPSWIGDPSFTGMVYLHLHGSRKCTSLPSLGQLPFLKDLIIEGMDAIKHVGLEFYGGDENSLVEPFPLLETLKFENMEEWEDWSFKDGVKGFPSLRELSIFRCSKLKRFSHRFASLKKLRMRKCEALTHFSRHPPLGNLEYDEFPCLQQLVLVGCSNLIELPNSLHSLERLEIDDSRTLAALPRLVKLQGLELFGSNAMLLGSMVDLSSLTSLRIKQMNVKCLPEGFMQQFPRLENLKIDACADLEVLSNEQVGLAHLASLQHLTICHCPKLAALPEEAKKLPPTLEFLDLRQCHNLLKLPHDFYNLKSLRELRIEWCPKLESFPEMGLPSMLQRLVVQNCEALKALPGGLLCNNTSLEYLEICQCPSLESILEQGNIPATLKHVKIYYCRSLISLPEGMMNKDYLTLEYLDIDNCSSLKNFPSGELPSTLKRLEITNCASLQSLPESLINLTRLDQLEIIRCPLLEYFPEGGFPTNLGRVTISSCEKLKSLPKRIHNLRCLQELTVTHCSSLESLPKQGLPTNLRSLKITDCKKLNPMREWKLHKLTSLEALSMEGFPGLVSFSNEYLLPHSIINLDIIDLPDLESLSEGLQNLSSLENLLIRSCHKLHSLPEKGLPFTLGSLIVRDCPLLKLRCKQDTREEWPKIKHIPDVEFT